MPEKRWMFLTVLFIATLTGCASRSGLNDMLTDITPPPKPSNIEEARLVYDGRFRGYAYDGKLLFNEIGEKIRTQEEAMERLSVEIAKKRSSSFEKLSFGEGIAVGVTAIYALPVVLVLGVTNEVVLLPTAPYTTYKDRKRRQESFENYVQGVRMLERGNYKEARLNFFKSLNLEPELARYSDVYFKLAETYEGQGQQESAKRYYLMFINRSVALYPAYFSKYDESYKNDEKALDAKFSKAEEKIEIKAVKTTQ